MLHNKEPTKKKKNQQKQQQSILNLLRPRCCRRARCTWKSVKLFQFLNSAPKCQRKLKSINSGSQSAQNAHTATTTITTTTTTTTIPTSCMAAQVRADNHQQPPQRLALKDDSCRMAGCGGDAQHQRLLAAISSGSRSIGNIFNGDSSQQQPVTATKYHAAGRQTNKSQQQRQQQHWTLFILLNCHQS